MKRRVLELAGIIRRYEMLNEGEESGDDLFGDDSGGDDSGDDSGGDDSGDDSGDEGGDTDEDAGDEEDKEEEKEEDVESLSAKEIAMYGPGEIEKVIDEKMEEFFVASQKSAMVRSDQSLGYPGAEQEIEESFVHRNSLANLLLEEEGRDVTQDIDITGFTSDVWNLMSNYETLLDMEGMIFNKAKQFIINQIDEDAADTFEELLALRHGWDPEEKYDTAGSQNVDVAPVAAGAAPSAVSGA